MEVLIKKLSERGRLPVQQSGSAGFDIFAAQDMMIYSGDRRLIQTDIAIKIPKGYYGHISDRSGMAYKQGAHCLGKILDPNFRGNVGVVMLNTDKENDIYIKTGDKIAQILFKKFESPNIVEVDNLDETERGEKGWGSSGR